MIHLISEQYQSFHNREIEIDEHESERTTFTFIIPQN